ncbi:MAG: tetratricopeptide repeat protein [Candidatus Omnitrophota bacterium]|nr:tetratricopeptide repeat protein [Candidatus Omnitrophota bacterium]
MKRLFIPFAIFVILLLTLLVYLPSFHTPFQFDDVKNVVGERVVENPGLTDIFQHSKSRFLLFLTMGLNYYFGKYNVFGYHLINLIIHTLSSLLVFALSFIIFNSPRLMRLNLKPYSFMLAFFSSMIFAIHPIQTQSVTYIWQRGESMAGMFYFLSIFLYARFRLIQINGGGKKLGWLFYMLCFVSMTLCSLTKETSMTLPAAILIYEICFLSKDMNELKSSLKYLIPILLFVLTPIMITKLESQSGTISIRFTEYYIPYYCAKIRMLIKSLLLMALPINQSLEYDFTWSISFTDLILTSGSLIILFSLIAICIFSFKRNPLISFAISWFYLTLSITTLVFLEDIFFEHYLYLPLFAYSIIVPALSLSIVNNLNINRKWWVAFIVILVTLYSAATYNRNLVWKTGISLWEDAVKKSPYKPISHYTLGVYYLRAKRYEDASKEYSLALKLKPRYPEAYYRLGEYYSILGNAEKSIENYKIALQINPEFFEAYLNLGNVYLTAGKYKNARDCFNNALAFTEDPRYIKNIRDTLRMIPAYE